jgi:hypothetical protein
MALDAKKPDDFFPPANKECVSLCLMASIANGPLKRSYRERRLRELRPDSDCRGGITSCSPDDPPRIVASVVPIERKISVVTLKLTS